MTQALLAERKVSMPRPDLDFRVDESLCTACGLCAQDCPMGLISGTPPRVDATERCARCQHCMAICPTGALSIEGRSPDHSLDLSATSLPTLAGMTRLVRERRSIRRYLDKDVDPALLDQILGTTAYAPTGVNALSLTFTLVDRKARLQEIREEVFSALSRCAKADRLPGYLTFLKPAFENRTAQEHDPIFRGAPHLLVVSAPLSAPAAQVDVSIALSTFEWLAVSAGLGTVWCGMAKMALEAAPELKPLLGLPPEGIHYYPMLFGYPAVTYARGVQRDDAAIVRRIR